AGPGPHVGPGVGRARGGDCATGHGEGTAVGQRRTQRGSLRAPPHRDRNGTPPGPPHRGGVLGGGRGGGGRRADFLGGVDGAGVVVKRGAEGYEPQEGDGDRVGPHRHRPGGRV